MKRLPVFLLTLLVIASMTWVAGCRSPESAAPGTDVGDLADREEVVDLNDEYGGFNMQDDQPAFGDPGMASEFVEDEAVLDRYAEDRDVVDEDRLNRHDYVGQPAPRLDDHPPDRLDGVVEHFFGRHRSETCHPF